MANILIKPKNAPVGKKDDKDAFVGIKFGTVVGEPSSIEVIFPFGYHYTGKKPTSEPIDPEKTQTALKKELYTLLCVIKRHGGNDNNGDDLDGTTVHSWKDKFPFYAYIAVIEDFMQYGYYIESEIKYKNAPVGKINWKRTIAQITPTIQKKRYPVYTDFIIRQYEKKLDNMMSLIHEWCVYEAFTKLGWLFTSFNPHKPALRIGESKPERSYFVSIILDSLKSTFNDRNKILFNAMIAMLRYGWVGGKETFLCGTERFYAVWENIIDTSYGVPESEKVKFYPEAKWKFAGKLEGKEPNSTRNMRPMRPDTIMRPDDDMGDVFILDAKYHSFVRETDKGSEQKQVHVPAISDINKQVTYGAFAAGKLNINKENASTKVKVYNAFLIPYDFEDDTYELGTSGKDEKYFYIGYAYMTMGDRTSVSKKDEPYEYERVLGILIDTKWLIQNAGKVNKKDLAKFITDNYKTKIAVSG